MAQQITGSYKRTLQASDLTSAGSTIAVVSSTFVELATYKVPAKQVIAVGNGRIQNGVDDRGVYSVNISTSAPANIPGVARLTLKDANRVRSVFIREDLSSDILNGTSSQRVGLGGTDGLSTPATVTQDELIAFEYKSTAASATATYANCTLQIPVFVWTLSGN